MLGARWQDHQGVGAAHTQKAAAALAASTHCNGTVPVGHPLQDSTVVLRSGVKGHIGGQLENVGGGESGVMRGGSGDGRWQQVDMSLKVPQQSQLW